MDAVKYDSHMNLSYQLTMKLKPSYYVMDNPVTLNIARLQAAIEAPRYKITEQECESVDSIREAILAFAI